MSIKLSMQSTIKMGRSENLYFIYIEKKKQNIFFLNTVAKPTLAHGYYAVFVGTICWYCELLRFGILVKIQ
jgi:hypothetical protein